MESQGPFLQQLYNERRVTEVQMQRRAWQPEGAHSEIRAMQKEREADFARDSLRNSAPDSVVALLQAPQGITPQEDGPRAQLTGISDSEISDIEDSGAQTQRGDCRREKDLDNLARSTPEDERPTTSPDADGPT
eukprot:8235462-Pyramimonas_sp.AAC.1